MNPSERHSKIYIEIVKQLRKMIEVDGLKPGDKIPSERELSERLNVGRSSVREALRAIELLGLIETRRGEGTFLRDFRGHQLVELLSTFILQDDKAKRDITETKHLIEMDCLRLIQQRNPLEQLHELEAWVKSSDVTDDDFFSKVVKLSDNHLFWRMWTILKDYYNSLNLSHDHLSKSDYLSLVKAMMNKEQNQSVAVYRQLRNLSND